MKYHLVKYGRPIFGDYYKALDYGPVPQTILDLLNEITGSEDGITNPDAKRLLGMVTVDRAYRYPRILARAAADLAVLSKSDVMALDHIVEVHGRKTFDELKALTHEMPTYEEPKPPPAVDEVVRVPVDEEGREMAAP